MENRLYAQAGVEPGDVWRQLVVRQRTQELPDTVSFVLAAPDGATLPLACPASTSPSRSRCPTERVRSASTA